MPALSQHVNVGATACEVLRAKGFQVWYDEQLQVYWAEKDGWDFMGDDPCGLLGVVSIYEHIKPAEFKDYWWRLARGGEPAALAREPRPYSSVIRRPNAERPRMKPNDE